MSVATPAGAALACQPSVSLTLQNNIQLNDPALAYYPIATGLKKPRHLAIDDLQNLLVVESGVGIMALTDTVACNGYEQRRLVDDTSLNTGIALHGTTLYASSEDNLYAWTYDSSAITVSDQHTVVSGMGGSTHGTRTIVLEPGNSPSYVILGRYDVRQSPTVSF
jgi:glucose/arabinose dehydrogenase